MKNIALLFFALLSFSIFAQVPQGINYQAIVRDGAGEPITSGTVKVTFRVYDAGSQNFEEDHLGVTPNAFGLVNLTIGSGTQTGSLNFVDIDWSQPNFKIEALVDDVSIGIQVLQSVPYTFQAAVADSVAGVDLSGIGSFQPWLTGPGTTYNTLDNIGIRTNNPVSLLQIGADFHVLDKTEVGFNCISTNGVSDGAGSVNYQTTDGAALMVIDQNLSGFFLYPSGPGGTEVADYNMNLKVTPNGVGINTDGVNATLDMGNNTDGVILPVGTNAERPGSPEAGYMRYNSDLSLFEGYNGVAWAPLGGASQGSPSGVIEAFAGPKVNVPSGYLICDGSPVSRASYPNLFAAIGESWGAGDGSTTFNLPNLNGRFLRGVDDGVGIDPDALSRAPSAPGGNIGDNVGTLELDGFQSHGHSVSGVSAATNTVSAHSHAKGSLGGATSSAGAHSHQMRSNATNGNAGTSSPYSSVAGFSYTNTDDILSAGNHSHSLSITGSTAAAGSHNHTVTLGGNVDSSGISETRPENASVFYIIKY